MAPMFIFAKQIQKEIRSGSKVIELPQGARLSAAAADLIRDHKVDIRYLDPEAPVAEATPEPSAVADEQAPAETKAADAESSVAATATETSAATEAEPERSEEDLIEEIVNRVIDRFNRIQGRKSGAPSAAATESQSGSPAAPDNDLVICRCEEITKGEIKAAIRNGLVTLNGIKRVTRAGMGLCQGQTCQRLVGQLLMAELGLPPAEVEPTTARGPVRPLRLRVFANS